MYFTQEDYIKIENWLQANSVKDTEFPEASSLSLNEQLTIIQRGENKRIKLEDLVNFLFSQSDSELDTSSTKPIQNQAVARAIYELQNRKFIEIVEELPPISNAKDNVVYILLDEVGEDNNLFTEWIKVNNTWEKVGEFKAEIDLSPYLKIQDSPFEKGSGDYSAVLKGGNNKVKGSHSFASGLETEALGLCSHAEGYKTIASGDHSHAEGRNTKAEGYYSHAEGNDNKASGDYSHVEGNSSHAEGPSSHAEGRHTWAESEMAHAEGYMTKAMKNASHTEGVGTVAENNTGEHAEGKYNKSNEGTIHSVGIGTSDIKRKNAHEILQNGKHYIYGIGGYDGTNAVTPNSQGIIAKSVQEVINELVNIINEITISETN